jgi:hypothetical protein
MKSRCQEVLKIIFVGKKIYESRTFQPISNNQRGRTETTFRRCRGIFIRGWALWTIKNGSAVIFILIFRSTKLV